MDALDQLAECVRTFTTNDDPAVRVVAEMALEAYKALRPRTVVLTFEKAKDVSNGRYAVLFTDPDDVGKTIALVSCSGVHLDDGDYASCEMPPLPGPEVFK